MTGMDTHPYHHYLFFTAASEFYQLPVGEQKEVKEEFKKLLSDIHGLIIVSYVALGFKKGTTFMLWCRAKDPAEVSEMLPELFRTKLGKYLTIGYSYFGIVRNSEYSGRTGKPEQVMQNYEDRLPYFILYPFTKTHEWHALDAENRRSIMGQHIKIGVGHPDIRQCLLYSYGVDDHEFIVSYETKTLEEFQDLVIEMRRTLGRKYTLIDTPTFTCIYKSLPDFIEWL
jgi:chlorite dismutase